MTTLAGETARRRTFAAIAHPDAGKSTLTEALALHAHVISGAGVVHGRAGRRSTVSDWMDMEKDRGTLIASSALQFEYQPKGHDDGPCMINLVDTPGHADFSKDIYRAFTTVDTAVTLASGAKGLKPQALRLFRAYKPNGIPIVTVINKRGRSGRTPLELMDETVTEIGPRPTPPYWPVGEADGFRSLLERDEDGEAKQLTGSERTTGDAIIAAERHLAPDETVAKQDDAQETVVEESEPPSADSTDHDQEVYLAGNTSPVAFVSAMLSWGIHQILNTLCELAPVPGAHKSDPAVAAAAVAGGQRVTIEKYEPTDGSPDVVFKVWAGMDMHHRDKLAFMRVVSSEFDRGMQVTHTQSGRSFSTKYALTVFDQTRSIVETVYPGDIAGLVNAGLLVPSDTVYEGCRVQFKPVPQSAPEHFYILRAESSGKYKRLRKAADRLDTEDVVQILRSNTRDDVVPVMATVGPIRFEAVMTRMENEYNVEAVAESIPYSVTYRVDEETTPKSAKQRGVETFTRSDGAPIALLGDKWKPFFIKKERPEFTLEILVADWSFREVSPTLG